jgi:hypothetical protein
MTYSSASTIMNYTKDDDEIDLDDNDNNGHCETVAAATGGNDTNSIGDYCRQSHDTVENDVAVPTEQVVHNPVLDDRPLSKAEAMKLRMRQLKQKMNQARQLNQQAVREELEHSIGGSGNSKQSTKKTTNKLRDGNQSLLAIRLAQEHGDIDSKLLLQPAYENIARQQKKQEKDELNEYAINDYHNPEGQYRNYQRNVKSLPSHGNSVTAATGIYDPTDMLTTTTDEMKKQRDGAHRIAQELQRRYDKRQTRERKRKQQEIRQELNDTSSSTPAAASGINLRNQKFNQKIARTYDSTTSEIRHNLERGTAL